MTNEEMLVDLKQFIEVTVSRQLSHVIENMATKQQLKDLEVRLSDRIDTIDEKIDEVQKGIEDTLLHITESRDIILQDHEKRLTRLEHKAA